MQRTGMSVQESETQDPRARVPETQGTNARAMQEAVPMLAETAAAVEPGGQRVESKPPNTTTHSAATQDDGDKQTLAAASPPDTSCVVPCTAWNRDGARESTSTAQGGEGPGERLGPYRGDEGSTRSEEGAAMSGDAGIYPHSTNSMNSSSRRRREVMTLHCDIIREQFWQQHPEILGLEHLQSIA